MVTIKPSPQHKQFCTTMEGSNLTALCHPQHKHVCISMGEDSDPHTSLSSTAQTSLDFNGGGFRPSHLSVIHSTNKFGFQWGILTITPLCHPQHKQVCISMGEDSNPNTFQSSTTQTSLHSNGRGFKPSHLSVGQSPNKSSMVWSKS